MDIKIGSKRLITFDEFNIVLSKFEIKMNPYKNEFILYEGKYLYERQNDKILLTRIE